MPRETTKITGSLVVFTIYFSLLKHIRYILNRVLTVGALYLATIAVMPQIIAGITGVSTFQFLIGGASILIIVSVVLDTTQQINAQLQMREYEEI